MTAMTTVRQDRCGDQARPEGARLDHVLRWSGCLCGRVRQELTHGPLYADPIA